MVIPYRGFGFCLSLCHSAILREPTIHTPHFDKSAQRLPCLLTQHSFDSPKSFF